MGFKLRKSFKLSSGFKLNVSKKGVSSTIGKKGLSINTGSNGTFINVGIPGTGLSYREKITGHRKKRSKNNNDNAITGAVLVGFIIGGIVLWATEIFWLSMLIVLIVPLIIIFAPEQQIQAQSKVTQLTQETEETQEIQKTVSITDTLYPNKYGLYPHEILALYLLPDENDYPKYWKDRYSVDNMHELLRSLMDRKFMTLHFPTDEEILTSYTVADLREIIKKHALKAPRKKIDMIQLILQSLPEPEIQQLTMAKISLFTAPYVLTELGKEAIKDDEYVLYAHRFIGDEFDIYSLNQRMKGDTLNYRKYIWQIFNEKCAEYFKTANYSAYRSVKLHMSKFFAEQKDMLSALRLLAEVIYIDINGLYDEMYPGSKKISEYVSCWNEPYEFYTFSPNNLAPGVIDYLYNYQKKLNLTNEQLKSLLSEYFRNINLPFQGFTIEECTQITLHAIEGEDLEIEKIYEQAKTRLRKQYPDINFT